MSLIAIDVPDAVSRRPIDPAVASMIDAVNEAIERFMLDEAEVSENFVTCDFHLLAQTIDWIVEQRLCTGANFCEFGAGFGAAAMIAAERGFDAVGIEIESNLARQANALANRFGSNAEIFEGSFVPRGIDAVRALANEVQNVDTTEDDIYESIGKQIDEFDLFFSFPWPGEQGFVETLVDACGADGALLLTYRGREGMHLCRKSVD